MTTKTAARSPRDDRYKHIEPLPDPPPREPFVVNQFPHSARANYILSWLFDTHSDTFWGGEGFLCQDTRPGSIRFVPDCMVAFGVDPGYVFARNGYVISEMGKPPDFVMEIGSRTTGRVDVARKREGYAGFGVPEYWRFDETGGDYHGAPLGGDKLVDGVYQPVPLHHEPDGAIWGRSEILGIDIYWQDKKLRIKDPATGEFYPEYNEVMAERNEVMAGYNEAVAERAAVARERDSERARRRYAEAQRDSEAEARAQAEAEVQRLRERLRRLENPNAR